MEQAGEDNLKVVQEVEEEAQEAPAPDIDLDWGVQEKKKGVEKVHSGIGALPTENIIGVLCKWSIQKNVLQSWSNHFLKQGWMFSSHFANLAWRNLKDFKMVLPLQ